MKPSLSSCSVALLCLGALANAVSPIQKVLQMLGDMKVNGVKQLEAEKEVFAGYTKYVNKLVDELTYDINKGTTKGEQLTATIAKAESDVQIHSGKIAELDQQIASLEATRNTASEMRKSEKASFEAQQTDYSETLYALDRAIQTLKAQSFDRAQAMALLQKSTIATRGMRRVLAALALAQTSDQQPDGAPAVAAYEFQSGGIVEMLENLQKKFSEEMGELEKAEMNSAHAHNMEMQHTSSVLANMKSERDERIAVKAAAVKTGAEAKAELVEVEAMLADAKKSLMDANTTYESKKIAFEMNQQVRAQEIEALEKAIQILSSPEALESYEKNVKVLLQKPAGRKAMSFLQVGAKSQRSANQASAKQFLSRRAEALHSRALMSLITSMADSPFAKVIDMIESLLDRLKEEAASEADHKAFCDEELNKNKVKRDQLSSEAERLRAAADERAVAVTEMAEDISQLAEEQTALRAALSAATETRTKEKEENTAAIKDAVAGQTALKQAISVLAEFYAQQGGALLQAKQQAKHQAKQVPEMAAYKGMQGENGGVIGMLEVIESDFARLEAETHAAETTAAAEYDKFKTETETSLKLKHDAEFKLSLEKDQADFEREQFEKDFESTTKELNAANAYYDALKPQCVHVNVSYEERVARRKEEIEALQEAYRILNGQSSA